MTFIRDIRTDRWEINTPEVGINFTDGKDHIFSMQREDDGRRVRLQVGIPVYCGRERY